MYVFMLLYPDAGKYDVSSVTYWIFPVPLPSEATWKQFKEKFGGEIAEGWGLTEAGANNMTNAPCTDPGRFHRQAHNGMKPDLRR
jgi:long-chain acyl-CoA synthetase